MFRIASLIIVLAVCYIAYLSYGYRYVLTDVEANADPAMYMGNANASITIIAYIDYDSSGSRQLNTLLLNLLASDQDIRTLIRPVATDTRMSQLATRLALAAKAEGNFLDVNSIFLSAFRPLDEKYLRAAITSLEIDYDALRLRALSGDFERELEAYQREAALLDVDQYPYFFVEHIKMPGATYTMEDLKNLIGDLRTGRR